MDAFEYSVALLSKKFTYSTALSIVSSYVREFYLNHRLVLILIVLIL